MFSAIASTPTDRLRRLFGYDAAGNRTTLQVRPAEVGQTVEQLTNSYVYDHLNRVKQVTQGDVADFSGDTLVPGKRVIFEYNRLGQYTFIQRQSDWEMGPGFYEDMSYSTYDYDNAGRLEELKHEWAGASADATYGYQYDLLDRITSFDVDGDVRSFDYDGNSQLKNDDGTSYNYDANGNRSAYDIGADNRIIDDGTYAYRYDAEGNRIARIVGDVQFDIDENPYPTSVGSSAVNYHYDHRNRLIEVISMELEQSGMIETRSIYTYDVDDRRDYRFNLDETQTATEERIVYDGTLPLVVWDDVNQFYLYGASGEVLAQEDAASGASWPLADHQQSVRIVLDATGGSVAEENDYDAFGNSTNEDFAFRFTHHGGELERLTNLIHMGPRVLDTTTNQFLQQDPAQESTNLYPYALNNPVNRHDRSGYFSAAHGTSVGGSGGSGLTTLSASTFNASWDPYEWNPLPAEQLTLSDLEAMRAAEEGAYPYYLPTSWPDIYRGLRGEFYEASQPRQETYTIQYNLGWGLTDLAAWAGMWFTETETRTRTVIDYVPTIDPKFPTAAAIYEYKHGISEFQSAVQEIGGYGQAIVDIAGDANPLVNLTTLFTGQSASGGQVGMGGQALAGMSLGTSSAVIAAAKAAQLIKNYSAGVRFEARVLRALGETKNRAVVESVTDLGRYGRTIPDVLKQGKHVKEIKNWDAIYLTRQLQKQLHYVDRTPGATYELIVGPQTHVYNTVLGRIREVGGKITVFDQKTGKFTPYKP